VGEGQPGRVQRHARRIAIGAAAVADIAQHRVPLGLQVQANLMGAAGLEARAQEGGPLAEALDHARWVTARLPPTGRSTRRSPSGPPRRHRQVLAGEIVLTEHLAERLVGVVGAGEDQEAAGVENRSGAPGRSAAGRRRSGTAG
jgi:hypothetical protein